MLRDLCVSARFYVGCIFGGADGGGSARRRHCLLHSSCATSCVYLASGHQSGVCNEGCMNMHGKKCCSGVVSPLAVFVAWASLGPLTYLRVPVSSGVGQAVRCGHGLFLSIII